MRSLRDEELVAQVQQGNSDAFAALVDRHKARVYHTLWRTIGDEQEAQDLAQEVFLKAYRALPGFRGQAAFATWLYRLTLNVAFDWCRARKRRPLAVPLEPEAAEQAPGRQAHAGAGSHAGAGHRTPASPPGRQPWDTAGGGGAGGAGSAEEVALRREESRSLGQALRQLSPDYRQALILRYLHDLRYDEIAARVHAPVRTIETRLRRGRAQLKALLSSGEGDEANEVHPGPTAVGPVVGGRAPGR